MAKSLSTALLAVMLVACDSSGNLGEVQQFVEETVNRPPGPIEPIPEFISYEPFTYSAANLRSPFDTPVDITRTARRQDGSEVRPVPNRPPEQLESFALGNLSMVGSISRDNVKWALVQDMTGTVHRVRVGNYMGRNHGRVVTITDLGVDLIEIVPSGEPDSWIERPQSITLNDGTKPTQEQK